MTKSASRQKANNANANDGKNANATATTGEAPVKPVAGKSNTAATQAVKAEATAPAAPTRDVQSAGKNANKNANANTNKADSKASTQAIKLTDLTPANVQRARQIRKTDCERFQKFHNFFVANDTATACVINGKANAKQEQVMQWLRGAVSPKTLASIEEIQEMPSALLALLIVSAALTKYGEQELARRDGLGEMDYVVGARFGTNGLRSKQHAPHNVGVAFLLQLVVGLAPEKRATCQILREILIHEGHGRLMLTPTNKGLQPAFGAVASDSDDWATVRQEQLRQMARQAQSDKFQETMQQFNGEHLYDAIRAQLKQVGGASVWETAKDKPALQAKNLRPRSGSADKSAKPQKDTGAQKQQQQTAKKNGSQVQSVKRNLPVEVEKFGQLPPPAPVTVKSANTKKQSVPIKKEATPLKKEAAPVKKEATPVKKEIKKETAPKNKGQNPASEKNATPVKNAAPVKNVTAGAIVNNARGGRATVSKAK